MLLTFVIVGAGPTGVELAGVIAEIARKTLKNDFRSIRADEGQIILLDSAPRVLMPFPEDLTQKAHHSLNDMSCLPRSVPRQRFGHGKEGNRAFRDSGSQLES